MVTTIEAAAIRQTEFTLTVLGRTLGHLGQQMYKRRDLALIELIANSWDAGATVVNVIVPEPDGYDKDTSEYVIEDNGCGMSADQIQSEYLVVGRNRRETGGAESNGRRVMGRKGVGKLAGFGMSKRMTVETWQGDELTQFALDINALKAKDGTPEDKKIEGTIYPAGAQPFSSGTRLILSALTHKTPQGMDELRVAIGRRFSRSAQGEMSIKVNGVPVEIPSLALVHREPEGEGFAEEALSDGNVIRYFAGYTEKIINPIEMRGFAVYANEKTAQAPPFFFNVEGTASGQHGTRYVYGEIYADFLDKGVDSDSDRISTDRQEIDWESDEAAALKEWGEALSRKLLRDWASRKERTVREKLALDEDHQRRLARLDPPSQKQFGKLVEQLSKSSAEADDIMGLISPLLQTFEYRHFHDLTEQIETAATSDPEELLSLLSMLRDWKVLESRAILEIIKGRLQIIEKFYEMIVNDIAEVGHETGDDNLHDLIAEYPWLLQPDWQVLAEEKTVTKLLRAMSDEEPLDPTDKERLDFLALANENLLVVVEIKRSGHAIEYEEVQRAERYAEKLRRGEGTRQVHTLVVANALNLSPTTMAQYERRTDIMVKRWGELHSFCKAFYEHYHAILEGEVTDVSFHRKELEVQKTRRIIEHRDLYRNKAARAKGLGAQDVAEAVQGGSVSIEDLGSSKPSK
ncbi:hypothetical protein BH09CHL1_BH09CHL1_20270 [soil metagenome]